MKHYDGKIWPVEKKPKGEIRPEIKLISRISIVDRLGKLYAQFDRLNALRGVMVKRATPVVERIKRLANRYVFFEAIARIFPRHETTADIAPTIDVTIDHAIKIDTETPLTPRPVEEIKVDRDVKFSAIANLVAYARAPVIYLKRILTPHIAKLISAAGAVADVREKIIYTILTSQALKAGSAIVKSRDNPLTATSEVEGGSATAKTVAAETEFYSDGTAEPIAAEAVAVNAYSESGIDTAVKLANWMEPVVIDGVLVLRQVYDATLTNGILEVI